MRTNAFGDIVVESVTDDLGQVEVLQESGDDIHAIIYKAGDKYFFDIARHHNGEYLVTSEAIFDNEAAARDYLRGFVSEIEVNEFD